MSLGNNDGGAVAGSFTLNAQLPNGKSLSFSGYVLQGEDEGDVNAKLDLAARAVDRQRMIAEVPELEAKLDQLREARLQMEAILETAAGKAKQTSQDKSTENTARINIQKIDRDIERGIEAVSKAKARMAGV